MVGHFRNVAAVLVAVAGGILLAVGMYFGMCRWWPLAGLGCRGWVYLYVPIAVLAGCVFSGFLAACLSSGTLHRWMQLLACPTLYLTLFFGASYFWVNASAGARFDVTFNEVVFPVLALGVSYVGVWLGAVAGARARGIERCPIFRRKPSQ